MAETDSEITVILKLTERDIARFYWNTSRRRFLLRQGMLIAMVLLLFLGTMLITARDLEWQGWLIMVVFLLLLSLVFLIYLPWQLMIRRAFLNNLAARAETTYRFRSQGIDVSHPSERIYRPWDAISEIHETTHDFFFFAFTGWVVLLPKTAIPSLDEQQRLRRLVLACAGDKAKLQPENSSQD